MACVRPSAQWLGVAALVVLTGCGPGGPPTYPVSGVVYFRDDSPVRSGVVEFIPDDGGPVARGKIDPQTGRFALATGDRPGAVAGPHRVVVVQLAAGADPHRHKGATVHRKHARPETTGLTRTVAPGKNEINLFVDPAG